MDEEDGTVRYVPNSADVLAMIEIVKLWRDSGDPDDREYGEKAERLFDAWYASLDIPDRQP